MVPSLLNETDRPDSHMQLLRQYHPSLFHIGPKVALDWSVSVVVLVASY